MYAVQIALALAVSMLIFATFASMVIEIFYKLTGFRQSGLKKMLEDFYKTEVRQRCRAIIEREGSAVEDMPAFVEKVTSMTGGSSTLSTIEFIRRLADTAIGKRFARRADSEVDILINDITERYEDYGRKASQIFRRNSAIGNVIVSVIVALSLNINAVTIFRAFQNNRELTQAIAGQAEQAMGAYQLQSELQKAAAARDTSKLAPTDEDIKELQASVQKLNNAVKDAKELGLPIGWSGDTFFNTEDIKRMGWVTWFLTTVFTGFLIGLGGPFWFDMVKRLSVVSQVTGALIRQPAPKDEGGEGAKPSKSDGAAIPEDPVAAFKTAVAAQRIIDRANEVVSEFLGPRALRL